MVSTIGSYVIAAGLLVFVVNVIKTRANGSACGHDPWLADTLEWYATSPPPRGTSTASRRDRAPGRCATCASGWRRTPMTA